MKRAVVVIALLMAGCGAAKPSDAEWITGQRTAMLKRVDPVGARHLKVSVSCEKSCHVKLTDRDGLVTIAAETWRGRRVVGRARIAAYARADRGKRCTAGMMRALRSNAAFASVALNDSIARCGENPGVMVP